MDRGGWSTGEQDTVTAAFSRSAKAYPDRLLVDFAGDRRTYAEFDRHSTALAHGLKRLGVARAEPVAALLDNTIDVTLYWVATVKIGAVVAALNTALKGEFLRNQMDNCNARVLVCESAYVARFEAVIDQLPNLRHILYRGERPNVTLPGVELSPFAALYETPGPAIEDENGPGDLAALVYTSGTTGPSKGCALSHNYAMNLARQIIETDDRRPGEIAWSCLPFFHFNAVATTFLPAVLLGGAAYFARRFSLSGFWADIERSGATVASLLGAMIALVGQQEDTPEMKRCYGQLRTVAGSPFPGEMQDTYMRRFGVTQAGSSCYGTTEACLVTMLPYGVKPKPGSSGKRARDFDVRIVDEHDRELPAGVAGEVIVRPLRPHVMFEGFYRQPEATMKIFRNLWYHSGDIGKFDEDGFFYFVDRKKDYLRRRGENISMYEMENTFSQHPDLLEVAAHAVPSALTEDDVKITAVLKTGSKLAEEQLCRWCLDRVPYYAVPRYIEFRDELPKTSTGKVEKFTLREQGCTPATWDREVSSLVIEKA